MQKLRLVGFKNYEPAVMFSANCHQWAIKNCTHPGSDVEFLVMLLEMANLDYELIQEDLNSTRIVDFIEHNLADLSLVALRIIPQRMQEVAFTHPINFLQFGYYVKELTSRESDEFLLKTFEIDVYMTLVLTFGIVATVFYLLFHRFNYKEWFWLTFAGFFNQHKVLISKKTSFMILTASWWFFSFLTICFYQAKMKYFLTGSLEKGIDFYNLNQLLDKLEFGKWTAYQTDDGYKPSMYCTPEQCKRIRMLEKTGKIINISNNVDMDDIIKKQPYTMSFAGYNYDYAPHDVNILDKENKILFIRDNTISVEMLGFAIRKNLTVELELLNRGIARFSSSYPNFRSRYTSPLPRYQRNTFENQAFSLTLLHMNFLFYFYFFLIGTAITAFGIEFLHFRYNWKTGTKFNFGEFRQQSPNSNINFEKRKLKHVLTDKIRFLTARNSYDLTKFN